MPGGTVIGIDLSGRMLELAAARLRREGLENFLLLRASALELPLGDGACDAVSACGGLHLYPDVPRAVAESRRVLRSKGRIAGLTFRSLRSGSILESALQRYAGVTAFDFRNLGQEFGQRGFSEWRHEEGGIVGYFSAQARG